MDQKDAATKGMRRRTASSRIKVAIIKAVAAVMILSSLA